VQLTVGSHGGELEALKRMNMGDGKSDDAKKYPRPSRTIPGRNQRETKQPSASLTVQRLAKFSTDSLHFAPVSAPTVSAPSAAATYTASSELCAHSWLRRICYNNSPDHTQQWIHTTFAVRTSIQTFLMRFSVYRNQQPLSTQTGRSRSGWRTSKMNYPAPRL
jgi:hypothetical protein